MRDDVIMMVSLIDAPSSSFESRSTLGSLLLSLISLERARCTAAESTNGRNDVGYIGNAPLAAARTNVSNTSRGTTAGSDGDAGQLQTMERN